MRTTCIACLDPGFRRDDMEQTRFYFFVFFVTFVAKEGL